MRISVNAYKNMPNKHYVRSRARESLIRNTFEKDGWYAIRAAGSHGIADIVALRPAKKCVNPAHYEVKFIQVKTSQAIKEEKIVLKAEEAACGYINVEYWNFPVKNAKFFEAAKKVKDREKAKKKKEKLKKIIQ